MPRKRKIDPARLALYTANNCSPETIESLERDLNAPNFDTLCRLYKVEPEPADNARLVILKEYFAGLEKQEQRTLQNRLAWLKHHSSFQKVFGKPLTHYWDGNVLGFNITKFDSELVRSGDRACSQVLEEKFGVEALVIVNALLGRQPAETPA